MTTEDKITGIVIAGGSGTRFGKNKALIIINGIPLIELVIQNIKKVADEVVVVTSEGQYSNITGTGIDVKIILDAIPGKAAMGGVYTGLLNSKSHYSLIVACDMPLLNTRLLDYMKKLAPEFDAVAPRIGNYIEPLHAIYSKDSIARIKQMIDKGDLSLYNLLKGLKTRYIDDTEIEKYDPNHLSMFNINTVPDLEKVEKILAAREK